MKRPVADEIQLFIIGTMGMLHSDDVLACFIAGNAFTWDDWFRQETEDDSLQPTIDMLLNVSIFVWYVYSVHYCTIVQTNTNSVLGMVLSVHGTCSLTTMSSQSIA